MVQFIPGSIIKCWNSVYIYMDRNIIVNLKIIQLIIILRTRTFYAISDQNWSTYVKTHDAPKFK